VLVRPPNEALPLFDVKNYQELVSSEYILGWLNSFGSKSSIENFDRWNPQKDTSKFEKIRLGIQAGNRYSFLSIS
jgi:hypothetical protein